MKANSAIARRSQTGVAKIAAVYFGVVFAAAFVLGLVRVLLIEPRIGLRAATLMEIPLLLFIIFAAARWLVRGRASPLTSAQCLAASVLAALSVVTVDVAAGVFLRSMAVSEVLLHGDPVAAGAYYLAIIIFAAALWIVKKAGNSRSFDA